MKDTTKQQLEDALRRLRDGEPAHPKLRASLDSKLGAGKTYNLVSIANVALEAGVSRTLIGYDGCQYPQCERQKGQLRVHQLSRRCARSSPG
ncbi:hypothetical protein [Xanthomonas phaseoli]|uniref:hypothetical protein n=1 Tax=Xanthomonas phaseoli TaxID=1985254 RepID=UPI00126775CA|nr:hypothetical protein [Xanthomonas phaseoli]